MRTALIARIVTDTRANLSIIFALAAIPLIFVTGMGIDYTLASERYAQLNAIADAAALAAVRPATAAGSDADSIAAAEHAFNAQAMSMDGISYDPNDLSATVMDTDRNRSVTVRYRAQSQNAFLGILGKPAIALSGSSRADSYPVPRLAE